MYFSQFLWVRFGVGCSTNVRKHKLNIIFSNTTCWLYIIHGFKLYFRAHGLNADAFNYENFTGLNP